MPWQHLWRSLPLLLVALLVIGTAGCGSAPAAPANPAGAPDALEVTDISMRFQWIAQWQFAGYIVAKVNGYYDEAGLNVTLNSGGPDFPAKQLVASGADTFGTAWVDSMYLSNQRNVPLIALATLFQTSPSAYMVHADAGIDGPADFADKTVAVYYGGGVETEYLALLQTAGVDRSQVREVQGEFNLFPFLQRQIDVLPVYATDQPDTARKEGADIELIFARDYGIVMMGDVLFTTPDFVERHPNTTRAFVEASLRGWNWAINNVEESIDLILAYNPELNREHLTFEARETIKLLTYGAGGRCIGWSDPAAWEAQQEMLLDFAILEAPMPFEQVADNRFVAGYYAEQGIDCAAASQ